MFFEVKGIFKSFQGKLLLNNISFSAEPGEIVSFVGPSGVGKTTLLKLIAGLETPDSGEILFHQASGRPNPAVMVFQDFLLFPNMTVFDNIAFGLRSMKCPRPEIRERVNQMLDCFQITEKKDHYPKSLSAGQRQRVAIARAMVINPGVLLLDEPFANLDKTLKGDTAAFIRRMQQRFGTTTIAVMHDQEEAFRMSDRIGVILEGRLMQFDRAAGLFEHPVSFQVASFLGQVNVVPPEAANDAAPDQTLDFKRFRYFFRSEAATLTPSTGGEWKIMEMVFFGTHIRYHIRKNELSFYVSRMGSPLAPGTRIHLTILRLLKEPI